MRKETIGKCNSSGYPCLCNCPMVTLNPQPRKYVTFIWVHHFRITLSTEASFYLSRALVPWAQKQYEYVEECVYDSCKSGNWESN